jgi:poly(3-hydroxyoctanoate) depolymerase
MPITASTKPALIDVAGVRLRVAVSGEGPPLLMVNGIGVGIEVWEPLSRRLDGRRLILFDAPGAAGSPATPKVLRIPALAEVVTRLLDLLGHDEPVDVLGYSFGGAVAQQLAFDHPERVRRLVLMATVPGLGGVQNPWVVMKMMDPRLARATGPKRAKRIARLVGGRSGREPALLEAYERRRMVQPGTWEGRRQQVQALTGWSSIHRLGGVRAPTLVLVGDADPIVPLVNSRIFTSLIPNARRHVIAGGGHLFPLDQPDEAAAVIEDFLTRPLWRMGDA